MTQTIARYPRLLLLSCSFASAYVLYHLGYFDMFREPLSDHRYASAFLGGLLFSFGFTAPFGLAIFAEIGPSINPVLGALLGGFGALLTDMCIFELARFSIFVDELHRLRESTLLRRLHALLHHKNVSERFRHYLLWSVAGLAIASPFPDEIGVTLLSGVADIDGRKFGVFCWALNTLGVLAVLLLAS